MALANLYVDTKHHKGALRTVFNISQVADRALARRARAVRLRGRRRHHRHRPPSARHRARVPRGGCRDVPRQRRADHGRAVPAPGHPAGHDDEVVVRPQPGRRRRAAGDGAGVRDRDRVQHPDAAVARHHVVPRVPVGQAPPSSASTRPITTRSRSCSIAGPSTSGSTLRSKMPTRSPSARADHGPRPVQGHQRPARSSDRRQAARQLRRAARAHAAGHGARCPARRRRVRRDPGRHVARSTRPRAP